MVMSKYLRKRDKYLQRLSKREQAGKNYHIGHAILKYRIEHNLVQDQIAEILGATRSQISQWESGVHTPSGFRMEHIKKKLGLDPISYCEVGSCNEYAEKSHLISRAVLPKELWDDRDLFMYMCRRHHSEFHSIGVDTFCDKYGLTEDLDKAKRKWAEYLKRGL